MDRSKAKALVNYWIRGLRTSLCLNDWNIDILWGHIDQLEPGCFTRGKCTTKVKYRRASIELNEEVHDTPEELWYTLRHELLHVVLAEYGLLQEVGQDMIDVSHQDVFCTTKDYCDERVIGLLERMLDYNADLTWSAWKPPRHLT